jgi:hypothetical protein
MKKLLKFLGLCQKSEVHLSYMVGETSVTISASGATPEEVKRLLEIADLFITNNENTTVSASGSTPEEVENILDMAFSPIKKDSDAK